MTKLLTQKVNKQSPTLQIKEDIFWVSIGCHRVSFHFNVKIRLIISCTTIVPKVDGTLITHEHEMDIGGPNVSLYLESVITAIYSNMTTPVTQIDEGRDDNELILVL